MGLMLVWGLALASYNIEVLTGFLFVVEATAALVLILFLLALNYEGRPSTRGGSAPMAWLLLTALYALFCFAYTRPVNFKSLNPSSHWDDYYAAALEHAGNDVTGLYLCYYSLHTPIFIMFAFIIFVATLICVGLSAVAKSSIQDSVNPIRQLFDFFKDAVSFNFKRQQSMANQRRRHAATRFVNFSKPENVTEEESGDNKR
jgi:hypothetical protein